MQLYIHTMLVQLHAKGDFRRNATEASSNMAPTLSAIKPCSALPAPLQIELSLTEWWVNPSMH